MASATPASLKFPRSRRIQQGRDFARIKAQGRRLAHGCLAVNWLASPAGGRTRVGLITSRKVGNAVRRNRARRLLRESFRLHQHEFTQPVELVLVARPSIEGRKLGDVEADLLTVLRRGGLLKATL